MEGKIHLRSSTVFRSQALKSILSILLFILTYVLLAVLSICFAAICVYASYFIIIKFPGLLAIVLALGLAGVGISIIFFLFKFIFSNSNNDLSHLMQISKEEEPELIQLVENIADEIGTHKPNKIFLSSEVNASVFYDSSFWSMFLPVKKNLVIGVGLINSVTKDELKAILSHEFGHFSQKSMKVGSYVYYANKVIFNLLYENDGYSNMMQRWGSVSGYFAMFAGIGLRIVQGIQVVLKSMYKIVNVSYMALSREMEFHADEVAVRLTGSDPLKNSLWRMQLSDYAFNSVLNYYDEKVSLNVVSSNIYGMQKFVTDFQASLDSISYKGAFPLVSETEQARFNKSKLEIKNQWASHPSTKERVAKMEELKLYNPDYDFTPANELLRRNTYYQEYFTNQIFSKVNYTDTKKIDNIDSFVAGYKQGYSENSFPKIYNNYYDNYDTPVFDITAELGKFNISITDLFSDEKVEWVYVRLALLNDIISLEQIKNGEFKVKTFDYDGVKYKKSDAATLIEQLNTQKEKLNEALLENDKKILSFFHFCAEQKGVAEKLVEHYDNLFLYDASYEDRLKLPISIQEALQFTQVTTPYNVIELKFENLKKDEDQFKNELKEFLNNDLYKSAISSEIRDSLDAYINNNEAYFLIDAYNDNALQKLYGAIHNYVFAVGKVYFILKKNLLEFQQSIL